MSFVDDNIILSCQYDVKVEHAGTIFYPVVLMKLNGRSMTIQYKILRVCEGKQDERYQHSTKNSMWDINITVCL